jgi:hypothetical protein
MHRRRSNGRWTLVAATFAAGTAIAQTPPSCNDTAPKQALVGFVARVARERNHACVRRAERIAAFDDDRMLSAGRLNCCPFASWPDRMRTLAATRRAWKAALQYAAVNARNAGALAKSGERALQGTRAASHAGITTDDFPTIEHVARHGEDLHSERPPRTRELNRAHWESDAPAPCHISLMRSLRSLRLLFSRPDLVERADVNLGCDRPS